MSDPSFHRLERLFHEARARPPGERSTFLDAACGDDAELRRELESLLRADADAEAEDFLDHPVIRPNDRSAPPPIRRTTAPGADLSGRRVAHYDILEELGRGGMGVVYRARDHRLGRTVALKFLPAHVGANETAKRRFIQEARAASALDHPNICTIHDIGETDDGRLYLAMACYEGETLSEKIAQGALPVEEALDYSIQMAAGLEDAHAAGIVHRDVKPANVMVTERGLVKLLDFGVAKITGVTLTRTGAALGTVGYMSPEQVRGDPVDERADLWALGVVLYEMLAGQRPFDGANQQAVMYAIAYHPVEPVTALRPEVPRRLEAIVERVLAKDRTRRLASARQMREELEDTLRQWSAADARSKGAQRAGAAFHASDPERRPPGGATPLVGRDEELDVLHRRFQRAQHGERQIVFVTGEPGVGKTSLVEAFLQQMQGMGRLRVGRGQCLEHRGEGEPYLPVLEALDRLCTGPQGSDVVSVLTTHAPTWLVQMPWLLTEAELERLQHRVIGTTPQRMLREFVHAIEQITRDHSLVLVLEDMHWSDPSTVQLMDALARREETARLLVVGTYRPAAVRQADHPLYAVQQELDVRGRCTTLDLPLLSASATADVLHHQLGQSLPDDQVRLMHRRTSGNPLFLRSLIAYWKTQGLLVQDDDGTWHVAPERDLSDEGVPDTLRQLIEQQLRHLTPDDQHMLEAASVVGTEFSTAAVAAGLDETQDDVELRCSRLARTASFLEGGESVEWPDGTVAARFRFVHSLYQEVLYDRVSAGRRVQLHRKIGIRLEMGYGEQAREHAAELALHFTRGHAPKRAVTYRQQAAERALQRSAHREAITHLTAGVGLLRAVPETPDRVQQEIQLQTMLASAYLATEGWGSTEAETAFERARTLCEHLGASADLVPVLFGMASMYELRGEYDKSEALIEKRFELPADPDEGGSRLESHELLACTRFHQGAFDHALEHAEHGLTLYDAEHSYSLLAVYGDDPGVSCHDWAALSLWFLGYPDRALERALEAVRLAEDHFYSLATAQMRAAWLHQCRREVEPTRQWAERARDVAERQGFPYQRAAATILNGWALAMQGRGADGILLIRRGIEACRAAGAEMDHPYFLALLAEAYGRNEQIDEGLTVLEEALTRVHGGRSFYYEAELHRLRGELSLHREGADRTAEADAHFQRALDVARHQETPSLELRAATSLGRLWLRQDRSEEARQLVHPIYETFTEGFDTPDLKQAEALLGVLSRAN